MASDCCIYISLQVASAKIRKASTSLLMLLQMVEILLMRIANLINTKCVHALHNLIIKCL